MRLGAKMKTIFPCKITFLTFFLLILSKDLIVLPSSHLGYAQDGANVVENQGTRIQDFEATDILSRELRGIETPDGMSRKYFEYSHRKSRVANAVKDLFFDEFLQIAIESPDDFGGWEITDNQAVQFLEKLAAYQRYRQEYLERIARLEDEDQIRSENHQLAKRRSALSQSLARSLLPAQAVALVPENTEWYGLLAHVANGHMLGKWLKITPSQLEKLRRESAEFCEEVKTSLDDSRQKSVDIFFKNLTKTQNAKFFSVFSEDKVQSVYRSLPFETLYLDHNVDLRSDSYNKLLFSPSLVLIDTIQGRPERLAEKESERRSNLHRPTFKISNAESQLAPSRGKMLYDRELAPNHFFAPEFALISLDLNRHDYTDDVHSILKSGLRKLLDRQIAICKDQQSLEHLEGTEKWKTSQANLALEYRKFREDAMAAFSDDRAASLLSSIEGFDANLFCIARWKSIRDWLGITDQQLERMHEESRELVSDMEANLVDLRQKSADILFSNLSPAQRDQFFQIFDRDKVAFFWGGLSYSNLYAHHRNVKGEHWFLWEGDPSPQKSQPDPLLKPTKLKFPK